MPRGQRPRGRHPHLPCDGTTAVHRSGRAGAPAARPPEVHHRGGHGERGHARAAPARRPLPPPTITSRAARRQRQARVRRPARAGSSPGRVRVWACGRSPRRRRDPAARRPPPSGGRWEGRSRSGSVTEIRSYDQHAPGGGLRAGGGGGHRGSGYRRGRREFPRGLGLPGCVLVAALPPGTGSFAEGDPRAAGADRRRPRTGRGAGAARHGGRRWPSFWWWRGCSSPWRRPARRARSRGPATRPRRRGIPSCSTTPARAAGRQSGSRWPTRPARGDRADRAAAGDDLSRSCARRSSAARTRSRWPAATARRRSSPRSPPSTGCRTRASQPGPATTSRSTSGSTATTSWARWTRSWTAVSGGWTSPRSTARCSSTTSH